ncbi:hypothetical protein BCR44DRAFT_1443020 [Catenaria anguillulae PL171]|uniref:F-box domain-containing protein n=1 Tax=Catenaria anguillulae PL171 TaxID=765915 RepID=A0A1Y2HDI1_9FUNG|nr:hypothetical protein BCR44DRAFT_1443020 [Catenaria anguillulae PL171]
MEPSRTSRSNMATLNLIDLADDILIAILSYLPPAALTNLERASRTWLSALRSPGFDPIWHAALAHAFPITYSSSAVASLPRLPAAAGVSHRAFLRHALDSALLLQWDLSSLELSTNDLAHPILTLTCPRALRSLVSTDQRLLLIHGTHLDPITAPAASIPYHLFDPLRAPRGFAKQVSHVVAHAAPGLIVYQLKGAHCVHIHWCTAGGAAEGGRPEPFVCWPRGAQVGVNGKGGGESVAYLPRRNAVVLGPRPGEVIVYDMGYVEGPPEVCKEEVVGVTRVEGGWVVVVEKRRLWVMQVGKPQSQALAQPQAPGQDQESSNKWTKPVLAYGDLLVLTSRDPSVSSPLVHVHVWSPVHCPKPRLIATNVLYAWPFADPSPSLRNKLALDVVVMDAHGHVHVKSVDGKQLQTGVGLPVSLNATRAPPILSLITPAAAVDEGFVDDTTAAAPGLLLAGGSGSMPGLTVGGKPGHIVLHVERSACGSVAAIVVPPMLDPACQEQQSPAVGIGFGGKARARRSSDLVSPPPYAMGGFQHHWE